MAGAIGRFSKPCLHWRWTVSIMSWLQQAPWRGTLCVKYSPCLQAAKCLWGTKHTPVTP